MNWHDAAYQAQSIALWVLILVLGVLVVATLKGGKGPGKQTPGGETPEQTVRRRYAAGEIDRETFQRMLADLEQTAPPACNREEVT